MNAACPEENELIQAENTLKRQRAQIEEKNRLMDEMIAFFPRGPNCFKSIGFWKKKAVKI